MKNGKNPNRKQRIAISAVGIKADNWLIYKHDTKLSQLHITHRNTGTVRVIPTY